MVSKNLALSCLVSPDPGARLFKSFKMPAYLLSALCFILQKNVQTVVAKIEVGDYDRDFRLNGGER